MSPRSDDAADRPSLHEESMIFEKHDKLEAYPT